MQKPAPQIPAPLSPEDCLARLDSLGVAYHLYHHRAVFTVAESVEIERTMPGTHCRNLFVRDKKETMFLVSAANETPIDMKKLQALLGCGRLSFGSPERLWTYLGVRPGSVCPFAVVNDTGNAVTLVLDKTMMAGKTVHFHPLQNTMTVGLAPAGVLAFAREAGHEPRILDLSVCAPDSLSQQGTAS